MTTIFHWYETIQLLWLWLYDSSMTKYSKWMLDTNISSIWNTSVEQFTLPRTSLKTAVRSTIPGCQTTTKSKRKWNQIYRTRSLSPPNMTLALILCLGWLFSLGPQPRTCLCQNRLQVRAYLVSFYVTFTSSFHYSFILCSNDVVLLIWLSQLLHFNSTWKW